MANLKESTVRTIKRLGFSLDDILFIGTEQVFVDQPDFWQVEDTSYDDGFGAPEVA